MGPDSIEGVDERRDEARAEIEVQVDGDHPAPAEGLCEGGDGGHSGGIDDDGMDEVGILGQGYWGTCYQEVLGFFLFSRGDNGPRRSNLIEEDDDLKQNKQIKLEQINRLYSRLVH